MLWLTVVLLQLKYHSGLLVVSDAGHVLHHVNGSNPLSWYTGRPGRVKNGSPVKYSLKTQFSPNNQLSWKQRAWRPYLRNCFPIDKLFRSPCNIPIPPVLQPLGEYMVQDLRAIGEAVVFTH